jgi:hypothetical protein
MQTKLLGIISVGFEVTDQLLVKCSVLYRYWRRKWEYSETVYRLFKTYDSLRKNVLYSCDHRLKTSPLPEIKLKECEEPTLSCSHPLLPLIINFLTTCYWG